MTVTSFDSSIPVNFIKEKSLQGRLSIFLKHVMCNVLKRDLTTKELNKISFIVVDKDYLELKYDNNFIGMVKLISMTKDFIFTQ